MTSFDLTESIIPRSDQLNAEDMLTGPRTVTITGVQKGSVEQPVDIHLAEFPGRPFKPSKTVRRILVAAWGPDASTYAGRRMTIFRDPAVRFGGMDVGGIRVSHLSHIAKPMTLVLAVSKGKRAPYVVQPLADVAPPTAQADTKDSITNEQIEKLAVLFRQAKIDTKDAGLAYIGDTINRVVASSKDLTRTEADKVIESLELDTAEPVEPTLPDAS